MKVFFRLSPIGMVSNAVGILTALFIYAVLTGKKVPFASSPKAAFVALFILGLSMSILAGTSDYPDAKFGAMPKYFMNPLMWLGIAAFILFFGMLFLGKLSFMPDYRQAFTIMSVIIAVKWVLTHIHLLMKALGSA